jgi:hypothetical protein
MSTSLLLTVGPRLTGVDQGASRLGRDDLHRSLDPLPPGRVEKKKISRPSRVRVGRFSWSGLLSFGISAAEPPAQAADLYVSELRPDGTLRPTSVPPYFGVARVCAEAVTSAASAAAARSAPRRAVPVTGGGHVTRASVRMVEATGYSRTRRGSA